jgi:integrase
MDDDPATPAPPRTAAPVPNAPLSVQMLLAVLDGDTFETVASRFGVTRTAVERRIKTLVLQLMQSVGVEGLNDAAAGQVRRLRVHRTSILAALAQFDLPAADGVPPRVLPTDEVALGAQRIAARSARCQHDLALYHLLFATGLRPIEVARLVVGDYLAPDGLVRRSSILRADAAIAGRARPLYFGHRPLDDALGAYLQQRHRDGHGRRADDRWRGLDPTSPLLLSTTGERYLVPAHEADTRLCCRPLLETCRKLFRLAGIPGLCVQSARLTLAARLYAHGADEDQVGEVLGIAERRAVRDLLPRPRRSLQQVLDSIIGSS